MMAKIWPGERYRTVIGLGCGSALRADHVFDVEVVAEAGGYAGLERVSLCGIGRKRRPLDIGRMGWELQERLQDAVADEWRGSRECASAKEE